MHTGMPITRRQRVITAIGLALLMAGLGLLLLLGRPLWNPLYVKLTGGQTTDQAIARYAPAAEQRLMPHFDRAGVAYPPASIALLALKHEKKLELWANDGQRWQRVHTYPVLAASGGPGPKLREGDRQVPEGLYRIEALNPNSSYHLSMKLNYPNTFDLERAAEDGRDNPGTNIFIHGKAASVGCLAMGDPAIEELFVLVHRVGLDNAEVIITPRDPRQSPLQADTNLPAWAAELYTGLNDSMSRFQHSPPYDSLPAP